MSLFRNDMKTLHTLGFVVWLPKQLFLSDRMTQKIPSIGEEYVYQVFHQTFNGFLIFPTEKKVLGPRVWCHAGHEQHDRLIDL
jgi:hypothetical protein